MPSTKPHASPDSTPVPRSAAADAELVDVLIVGTGFSGLIMALEVERRRLGSVVLLEKGDDIGGTWRDNTYPGAACDIPSHLYSIAAEPKSDWSRMFAGQAEILDYLRGVARRHGLYERVRFGQSLARAVWDETDLHWRVETEQGETFLARVLVSAVGALHIPSIPAFPGDGTFSGPRFHSAQWDHGYELEGKRVAVIGTGASAIQFIPRIAPRVAALAVYQRTPPWVLPKRDHAFPRAVQHAFATVPGLRSAYRSWLYNTYEFRHRVFRGWTPIVALARKAALANMRAAISDRELRAKLTPSYEIGCKRILQANDYYPALARANVEVVTESIARIEPDGIVDGNGIKREADAIIYGTGFHTTDAFDHLEIVGRGGLTLATAWARGLAAHRGTAVAGFPNFFMLLGPNTGLGHNSVVLMIEAQADSVGRLLEAIRRRDVPAIDVRADAQRAWCDEVQARLATTVWQLGGCRSWYQDAHGNNTTLWPGTVTEFRQRLAHAGLEDFDEVDLPISIPASGKSSCQSRPVRSR